MAYSLLMSEDTVHVLSPTVVVDAVQATIATPTHNVIASSMVPAANWGQQAGIDQLEQVAFDIDWLLDHTAAIAATGTQSVDNNGLLALAVTFTVGYTPPGSTTGPLTTTVDVPMPYLEELIAPNSTSNPGLDAATALIAAAETSLQTMAGS